MKAEGPRVRIEELRLAGFRAFENARLTLDDLTVLVGKNGAGKSTIVDAFEFLREALTDSLENALERRGGIQSLARKSSRRTRELAIAVSVRLFQVPELRRPQYSDAGDRLVAYGFRISSRTGGVGFVVDTERAAYRDGFRGLHMPVSRGTNGSSKTALALPLTAQSGLMPRLILEAVRTAFRAYKFSPAAIRSEPPIGPADILNRDGSNAGDVLKRVGKDDLTWIVKHLSAITPGIVDIKAGTAAGRRIVQFVQNAGGAKKTRFEIGDMSDGTLRSLAILLALRQKPSPALVCIDEIEDSVHPAALAVLLDAVAASTERCQILLTSHSPEALGHPAVTAGRVRVVDWKAGKSQVFRLSKGAAEMSRPPRSVGTLLRSNALFTDEQPERVEGDFFEAG